MNRKKRLVAWIVAFAMIWVQLPTMQVMATNFDPQQQGDIFGEEVKTGTVLKAGKDVIINTTTGATITVYYCDAEENSLDTKAINKANGQEYAQYTVETVNSISNWEVKIISESGGLVDQIQLIPYKSVDSIDIDALSLDNKISGGIGYQCYQLTAEVLPLDAKNKSVSWAVYDEHMQETDKAIISIDPSTVGAKLLEVKEGGTYTVRALAEDGCGATDDQILTVSIPVSGVTINSADTVVNDSTLNMRATITPINATNQDVTWSVTPGTGAATIDSNGVLSATAVGTVTVTATSVADNTVSAIKEITITPNTIPVSAITVNSYNNATSVLKDSTLNMSAVITPSNATDKNVTWSVTRGTGNATISDDGVLRATAAGTVTVTATSVSNPNIFGTKVITITVSGSSGGSGGSSGSSSTGGSSTTGGTDSTRDTTAQQIASHILKAIEQGDTPTVVVDGSYNAQVPVEALEAIVKAGQALVVQSGSVGVTFNPPAIKALLGNDNVAPPVQVAMAPIIPTTLEQITQHLIAAEEGTILGGRELTFSLSVNTAKPQDSFVEPLDIQLDLSKLNLKDFTKLTLVRYEIQQDGSVTAVKLGGKYDEKTKSFTAKTGEPGLYGVMAVERLTQITLKIDHNELEQNDKFIQNDVAPEIINGLTMMPLRAIAESLGAEVKWDGNLKEAMLLLDGKTLVVGKEQGLMIKEKEGRTLVPVRYIAENLGANVLWIPSTRQVQIVR